VSNNHYSTQILFVELMITERFSMWESQTVGL